MLENIYLGMTVTSNIPLENKSISRMRKPVRISGTLNDTIF